MVEKCKKCGHEQDMEVCDWCRAEEMHEEEIRELYGGGLFRICPPTSLIPNNTS